MARSGYCANASCGVGPVELIDGLCRACYQYRYRRGDDRPHEVVLRSYDRTVERLERSRYR